MKHGYENKDQMDLIQLLGYNEKLQMFKEFATDRTWALTFMNPCIAIQLGK